MKKDGHSKPITRTEIEQAVCLECHRGDAERKSQITGTPDRLNWRWAGARDDPGNDPRGPRSHRLGDRAAR